MAQISLSDTAFEGVRLIGRKPLAVLIWAAVIFVAAAVPIALFFGTLAPAFTDLMRHSMDGSRPSPEEMMKFQLRWMAANGPIMLFSLAARAVLMSAVFRAVLRPEDSRFAYLRLGKAELLTGLVYLCVMILLFMVMFAGMIVLVGLTVASAMASKAAAIGVAVVLGVALIGLLFWVILRLILALPMTFAEGQFRMFEAWQLSRGHALQLFFIGLLAFAMVLVIEMVVGGVIGFTAIGVIAGHANGAGGAANIFHRPAAEWIGQVAPWLVLGGAILALFGAAAMAIMYAPLAAAYRALVAAPVAEAV
jgi:hypothetical protein